MQSTLHDLQIIFHFFTELMKPLDSEIATVAHLSR
jgi:hypothetical protein